MNTQNTGGNSQTQNAPKSQLGRGEKFLNWLNYHWFNFRIWLRRLRSFHSRAWGYFGVIIAIGSVECFFAWRAQVVWYYYGVQRSNATEALAISLVVFLMVLILGFVLSVHRHWTYHKIIDMIISKEVAKDEQDKTVIKKAKNSAKRIAIFSIWGTITFVVLNDMAGAFFFIFGPNPDIHNAVNWIMAFVMMLFTLVPYPIGLSSTALHEGIEEENKEMFGQHMVGHKRTIQMHALNRLVKEIRDRDPEKVLGPGVVQFMQLTADQQMEMGIWDPQDLIAQKSAQDAPQLPSPRTNIVPFTPQNNAAHQPDKPDYDVTGQFTALDVDAEDVSTLGGASDSDPFLRTRLDHYRESRDLNQA